MSIESLKQKARKAEQNEDWKRALEHYDKALTELAREEQVDIGLYNRVGDLYVRVNRLDKAVDHYEKAVELYREAYLPNNAIAVCKKIIRNVPDHHQAYLVIGQIRAEQGFIPDARTNFLTYAERMQQVGDLDESFRALVEFCDLAPDDVGVRITVAEQMAAQDRTEEAVEQLLIVRRRFSELGESEKASEIEAKILELDPEADLTSMPVMGGFAGSDDGGLGQFGEISIGADAFASGDSEDDPGFAVSSAMEEAASEVPDDGGQEEAVGEETEPGSFDISASDEDAEEAPELPTMDFGDDDEDAAVELPMMDFGDDEDDEDEAPELPTMDFEDDEDEGAVPTTSMEDFSLEDADVTAGSDVAGAMEEAVEEARSEEPEITPPAPEPVPDPETTDAPATVTPPPPTQETPAPPREPTQAQEEAPPPQEAAPSGQEAPPPQEASSPKEEPAPKGGGDDSFVDLGAMILGDDREEKKSTRFTVAYQEPSGDEEADFAKMLSQFKDKVSENLDSSDVRAHYDLGTAYKEMGLLDEAITSFQAALRASANHLPTYELMGQTFIEMGQPEAAVRSLERALQSPSAVEDELVGIYYYLGRAYEELEKKDSAVDYYDRVFALDINFADVTERLRELR